MTSLVTPPADVLDIPVRWSNKQVTVSLPIDSSTIEHLRNQISLLFPTLQPTFKILNLKKKKKTTPSSSSELDLLSQYKLPKIIKIMGSTENAINQATKGVQQRVRDDLEKKTPGGGGGGGGARLRKPPRKLRPREYGFSSIDALDDYSDKHLAIEFLRALAEDSGIINIMKKHRFKVGVLKELPPTGEVGVTSVCLMGLNVNAGAEILLRLRTDKLDGFRKYDYVKKVLIHELTHNVHGDHDNDFKKLNSQLLRESVELDWTRSKGRRLGSSVDLPFLSSHGGGGRGGAGGDNFLAVARLLPRQESEEEEKKEEKVEKVKEEEKEKVKEVRADVEETTSNKSPPMMKVAQSQEEPCASNDPPSDPPSDPLKEQPENSNMPGMQKDWSLLAAQQFSNPITFNVGLSLLFTNTTSSAKNDVKLMGRTSSILLKILQNILVHPSLERYRVLKLTNAKLRKTIFSVHGGVEFLIGCGFQLVKKCLASDFKHLSTEVLEEEEEEEWILQLPVANGTSTLSSTEQAMIASMKLELEKMLEGGKE